MVYSEQNRSTDSLSQDVQPLSKVCDAADWFRPEILDIIQHELNEFPRFHRKQWEFAMIIHALKRRDMLDESKVGLSMGSGNELVLYSIARKVKHLTATDLYSSETLWDCARAANPDEYIRESKPFPVDDAKLAALTMDMRKLSFEDNSFDFAYSSCAFEHIGDDADFMQHLNEVYRVLKYGGVYVMTTEFTFANDTVPIPNNYLFSPEHLNRLVIASRFIPEAHFDARLTEQSANFPLPLRVTDLSCLSENLVEKTLLSSGFIPIVQMLHGKHPFTSSLFVLIKGAADQPKDRIVFRGLEESRAYLQSCVSRYHAMIQADLSLSPFSFLPGGISLYYAPHFLQAGNASCERTNTIFHTNYYWFGAGARRVIISLGRQKQEQEEACFVEIRVHRLKTEDPTVVDCSYHDQVMVPSEEALRKEVTMTTDENYMYAILAVLERGSCLFADIHVCVSASPGAGISAGHATKAVSTGRMPFFHRMRVAASLLAPEWVGRIYRRSRRIIASLSKETAGRGSATL